MIHVITLRPALSPDDRAFVAMEALAATLRELEALAQTHPDALRFYEMQLDHADTDIALLRARLRMKQTTTALCNHFGRAP